MEIFAILTIWLICGVVSAVIASNKGRNVAGWFALGMLFGLIAIIIVAAIPSLTVDGKTKRCPHCAELVKTEATVCRHCGRDLQNRNPESRALL